MGRKRAVGRALGALVLAGGLSAVGVAAAGGVASAQPGYPPTFCALTISVTAATPGATITISGSCFGPGSPIVIVLFSNGTTIGSATANGSGSFTSSVQLPSSLSPGTHTIEAIGTNPQGGQQIDSATIQIVSPTPIALVTPPVSAPPPALAFTGADIGAMASVGGLMVAGGGGLLAARRRRRRREAAA